MQTRSKARHSRTKRSIYRSRVKSSPCKGQTQQCREKYGCKKSRSGKRKSYCRKIHNRHA